MFLLSRRQAHAAATGVAAAAAYLAAAELGSKRPVRVGGLFLLASVAMAGTVTRLLPRDPKIAAVENRLNHFISNGGSVGGNFASTGALSAQSTTGQSILGSIMGDQDGDSNLGTCPNPPTQGYVQSCASRINNLISAHNALTVDCQAGISRVNNFTAALG